jgi:hypothetical protein
VATLRRGLRPLVALALALSATALAPAHAQQTLRLVEQDIKAGLLYNFLRYTEWPARSDAMAVVCLYGADPFDGKLAPMVGRTVNQQTIAVRNVRDLAEVDACTLLFVNAEERTRWPQLRDYLGGKPVLTVSDYDGFAGGGGMIEFTRAESRIGVRINVEAIGDADLMVQDRLLRLASAVAAAPTSP